MAIRIQLVETPETYEVAGASFTFVRANSGHVEDAVGVAGAKDVGGPAWTRRYNQALWGTVLRGWSGIEDVAGRPVPFAAPAEYRDKVRAEAIEAGERDVAEDTIAARAQREWVYGVVRALPSVEKGQLQGRVMGDRAKAADALGN